MTSAPTLEDVAARAGVSTATVSRCLNAPDKVVAETRNKVMQAVDALGYAPNFSARALAARRTQTMGAVIPTMSNAIFAQGLQAFQERLSQSGYMLLVASSYYDRETQTEQVRSLAARGADGILLIGHDRDAQIETFLNTQNVPFVSTWTYHPGKPSIGFDNFEAMKALASRAMSLGHRKIGVISAKHQGNDRARDRVQGILVATQEAGVSEADIEIVETEYGLDNGATAFERLMRKTPTLILCGNDVLAAGALRRAHQLGLDVPQDVSITGFDDIELAGLMTPRLTTVHVPHREMGIAAAEALIAMTDGTWSGESLCLPTYISDGETLAPPKK